MHELSLVEGIIQAVSEVADERRGKVRSFEVRVGELAQFDIRLIKELLTELKAGTELEGATVAVLPERCRVRCKSCNSEWRFTDLAGDLQDEGKEMVHFFPELLASFCKCPACSKSYFEILEGRSVRIEEVVLDV